MRLSLICFMVGMVAVQAGLQGWTAAQRQLAVDTHNILRCKHSADLGNIPVVGWSDKAATAAQCWAKTMAASKNFAHSRGQCGTGGMGENIAWTMGMDTDPTLRIPKAIRDFYDEVKNYDAGRPGQSTNGGVIGHFTQVVWKKSHSIGCASATNGREWFFTCNYIDAGNYGGQYDKNVFCSNRAGQCREFSGRSDDQCRAALDQMDNAGPIQWSVTPGRSASNRAVVPLKSHVDMASAHAEKICHSIATGSRTPADPQCRGGICVAGNHEDYVFEQSIGTDVTIKVKGCASSGHEDSAVAIGYFKIGAQVAAGRPVYKPVSGSTVPMNTHVYIDSANAEKICYNVDQSSPPTCRAGGVVKCQSGQHADIIVDHDEKVQAVGCISGAPNSQVVTATFKVEKVDHHCDQSVSGSFKGFLQKYCQAGCWPGHPRYLMVGGNCRSIGYNYFTSDAEALNANPGKFIFSKDGDRCAEFGVSRTVCKGGAAETDASNKSGETSTSAAGWTVATTIVLVVGLVGMAGLFAIGIVMGKNMKSEGGSTTRSSPSNRMVDDSNTQELL